MDARGGSKLNCQTASLAGVYRTPAEKTPAARRRESQLRATIEAVPDPDSWVSWAPDSSTHLHVQLPGALIARVADSIGHRASDLALPLLSNDEVVCRLSLLLLDGPPGAGTLGHVYAESISTALIVHLFAGCSVEQHHPSSAARLPGTSLRRIIDYMETHLEEELSIRKLAALVSLSPSHFSALFTRATGIPPHRFIIQRRLERARDLLGSTQESIAQIAVRVGFCDQSHLAKHMRHILELSPGHLRRKNPPSRCERGAS